MLVQFSLFDTFGSIVGTLEKLDCLEATISCSIMDKSEKNEIIDFYEIDQLRATRTDLLVIFKNTYYIPLDSPVLGEFFKGRSSYRMVSSFG